MCVSTEMKNTSNHPNEEFDPSLAITEEDALESSSLGGLDAQERAASFPNESAKGVSSSSRAPSPLMYHDHFDVKEEEMGVLVKQNLSTTDPKSKEGDGDAKPAALDEDGTNSNAAGSGGDIDSDLSPMESKPSKRKTATGPRGGVYEPFPLKLHRMLATVEEAGLTSAVSWKSHGRAFQVNHVNQFVQSILPKFFRQTKLTSFQRQLNLYGFRRIIHGTDSGAYYHELFLRGKPFLCRAMIRTKVKGKSRLRAADLAASEPDFYKMKPLPVLTVDDYKKSKNILLNVNDNVEGGEESSISFSESSTNLKRRRGSGENRFDTTFNPFLPIDSDETSRANYYDPHWVDPMRRYPPEATPHGDRGGSMPSNYMSNWQTRPEDSSHISRIASSMISQPPNISSYHHDNRASDGGSNQYIPPQSMYGMQTTSAGSRLASDSPYRYQQSQYPPQTSYWNNPPPYQYQYQYQSSDNSGFHYNQSNSYNLGNDTQSPYSHRSTPNASREPILSQSVRSSMPSISSQGQASSSDFHSRASQQSNREIGLSRDASEMRTVGSEAPSSAGVNASASDFADSMSPIKNTTQEQNAPIDFDAGDMKDFLNDFMIKKEK